MFYQFTSELYYNKRFLKDFNRIDSNLNYDTNESYLQSLIFKTFSTFYEIKIYYTDISL